MKKRVVASLIVAAMALTSLAGCGGSSSSTDSDSSADSSTETQEDESDNEEAEETTDSEDESSEEVAEADTEESGEEDEEEEDANTSDEELDDWEQELSDLYETSGDESYVWGFVAQNYEETFSGRVQSALEEYTAEAFPNVTLKIADGKGDPNVHIEQAENFITQGVDCLINNAADSDAEVVICEMCQEAGVPFVEVNADINCDPLDHWFVGSDHYVSGHLEGEYLVDTMDDSDTVNICYLGGTEGFTHTTLRREGFYDALDEAGFNYELLSDLEGEYMRDKGMEIAEDWVTQYGDQIDAIVAANDEMAMGALNACQAAGLNDIVICGIDLNDDTKDAIEEGKVGCSVFQNAEGQGKWAAVAAYAACQGMDFATLPIPYELVTIDNLADYR